MELLKSSRVREEIHQDIGHGLPGWFNNQVRNTGGWHGVKMAVADKPKDKQYEGKQMDETANAMHTDPVNALCNLLRTSPSSTRQP